MTPLLPTDMTMKQQARLQINELLRTPSQIERWGHANELLTGDSDFVRGLREWYRDFSGTDRGG